jgi:hypothetical protein
MANNRKLSIKKRKRKELAKKKETKKAKGNPDYRNNYSNDDNDEPNNDPRDQYRTSNQRHKSFYILPDNRKKAIRIDEKKVAEQIRIAKAKLSYKDDMIALNQRLENEKRGQAEAAARSNDISIQVTKIPAKQRKKIRHLIWDELTAIYKEIKDLSKIQKALYAHIVNPPPATSPRANKNIHKMHTETQDIIWDMSNYRIQLKNLRDLNKSNSDKSKRKAATRKKKKERTDNRKVKIWNNKRKVIDYMRPIPSSLILKL